MTYSPDFLNAVEATLSHEGGYSNDPYDRGGETNFGISKRAYPKIDIKNLTREQAIAIYHADYWLKLQCDSLPTTINAKVFDIGVNSGLHRAVTLLQVALNAYNGNAALKIDGAMGQKTIGAASLAVSTLLLRFLNATQAGFYTGLVGARPNQERFINGWLKRAGVA